MFHSWPNQRQLYSTSRFRFTLTISVWWWDLYLNLFPWESDSFDQINQSCWIYFVFRFHIHAQQRRPVWEVTSQPPRHNGLCTRWWYTKWIYILIVEQIQMWNTRRKTISNKWENRNLFDINALWTIIQKMYFHITNTTWLYKMYKYKRYIYKSSTSLSWALVHFDF